MTGKDNKRRILEVLLNGGDLSGLTQIVPAEVAGKFKNRKELTEALQYVYGPEAKIIYQKHEVNVISDGIGFWLFYQMDDGYHWHTNIVFTEEEHNSIVEKIKSQSSNWHEAKDSRSKIITFVQQEGNEPISDEPPVYPAKREAVTDQIPDIPLPATADQKEQAVPPPARVIRLTDRKTGNL